MNFMKKAVAVGLSVCMIGGLTACGSTNTIDATKEFATVEGNEDLTVTMDVANFMTRYSQAMYETYYKSYLGDDMWTQSAGGEKTYEDNVKDTVSTSVEEMLVLAANAENYGISISDEEEKTIEEAAKKFMEENTDEKGNEIISASEDVVKKVLELYTYRTKMHDELTKDVDMNVSDEEALQKAMGYIHFEDDKEDEGTRTAKEKAEEFYKGLESGKDYKEYAEELGYDPVETAFDLTTTSPDENMIKAVWNLKQGEYTEIIETEDNGCFIALLTNAFDKEATEAQKDNIRNHRTSDEYTKAVANLKKDTKVTVNKDLLKDIDFINQGVTMHQDETSDESAGTISAE